MQPAAAKTASELIKLITKKAFSGSMTGLHWTIAAGQSFHAGLTRAHALWDEKKTFANLADADEDTTQFIKCYLEKTHHTTINAVKVDLGMRTPMECINKHIIISYSAARKIEEALETNNQTILNEYRGILDHENNHIESNDLMWRTAANFTLPFVTHGSVKIIRNALPIAKKTRSFLSQQFIKIPTAFGKDFITASTDTAIARHHEQRADDNISNNIDLLEGFKTTVKTMDQERQPIFASRFTPNQLKAFHWTINFFEGYPLLTTRIEKLDKRIALLKKQSQHDEHNHS